MGYVHGSFIPTLRLLFHNPSERVKAGPSLVDCLYGAHEVGYRNDILTWSDEPSLRHGLAERISNILYERIRIGTQAEADAYFDSASRADERIFVSYSGKDEAAARPIKVDPIGWTGIGVT